MLAPVRLIAPAIPPVTLDEVKASLRVDFDDDDDLLTGLIDAATDHMDGWRGILGRAIVAQTWRQDFPGFGPCMRLPVGPVTSIVDVIYYDGNNAEQTLDTDILDILTDEIGSYVALKPDNVWPATYTRSAAVRVSYVAGDAVEDVPAPIRVAMLLLIGHLYQNREATTKDGLTQLPLGVAALLAPYCRARI